MLKSSPTTKVWDLFIRLFHWSLVAAVAVALITEDEWMSLHLAAGAMVAVLVCGRLLWGVVGSGHARFTDFIQSPRRIQTYLRQLISGGAPRHVGHNPAGGLMVIALLGVLLATTLSGFLVWNSVYALPVLGSVSAGFDDATLAAVEGLHEMLSNTLLVLIVVHLCGVVLASLQHRENLVAAMLHGKKRLTD